MQLAPSDIPEPDEFTKCAMWNVQQTSIDLYQHKTKSDTFLSFFSSFVSTRVGGGVSFGFYITVKDEALKYLSLALKITSL